MSQLGTAARRPWHSAVSRSPVAARVLAPLALALAAHWPAGAHADAALPAVGLGQNALPGVDSVGVLADLPPGAALIGTLGYGYTEPVLAGGDDAHHRLGAQFAAGYALAPWLGAAARVDGRYDAHSGGPEGDDDGVLAQSQLLLRAAHPLDARLRLGGEAALRVPGASDFERGLSSLGFDVRALCSFSPPRSGTWLSGALGFRLDRASHGVEDPSRLALYDRVALGASDANALLIGLALSQRVGAIDLLGEWSWDLQIGERAVEPLQSPLRIEAGARFSPTRALQLQLIAGVSPSARPVVSRDAPLQIIEPRVWIATALGVRFPSAPASRPRATARSALPPAPPAPRAGTLRGVVVEAGARSPLTAVTVEVVGAQPTLTDAQGRFALPDLAPGEHELRFRADGFRADTRRVQVVAGGAVELDIALERALPEGQIRGSVRGFDGKPLAASVRVEPLGRTVEPDALGNFELDVAPGEYTVVVSAPGHEPQTRPAVVELNGVTVVIVELNRAR